MVDCWGRNALWRRCRRIVEHLDLPRPFDAREFIGLLALERGRPIELIRVSGRPNLPCGLMVRTDEADLILYSADTSALHRRHILLHEAAHLVCGHGDGAFADSPDAASAAALLGTADVLGTASATEKAGTAGKAATAGKAGSAGTTDSLTTAGAVGTAGAARAAGAAGAGTAAGAGAAADAATADTTAAAADPSAARSFGAIDELLPHLPAELVRRVLGRTVYSEPQEREAELVASLILYRVGRDDARPPGRLPRPPSRLEAVFGLSDL